MNQQGSIWIAVNANGYASCPYCEALSFNRAINGPWHSGCKHVVNPGSVKVKGSDEPQPAIIFQGDQK
jgi:hypothetical protein